MSDPIEPIILLIEELWGSCLPDPARTVVATCLEGAIENARTENGLDFLPRAEIRREIIALQRLASRTRAGWDPRREGLKRPSDDTLMWLGQPLDAWTTADGRRATVAAAQRARLDSFNGMRSGPGRRPNMAKRGLGAAVYDLFATINHEFSDATSSATARANLQPTSTPKGPFVRLLQACFRAAGLPPGNAKAIAAKIISQNHRDSRDHWELRDEREQERRKLMRKRSISDN
ncbi:hypothetical protein [Elioraea sp.]|uniref:hypothetical protein n=1 Tax=Elioraea sp. TaxID=2185103 RepID=UPI003F6FBC01